MARAVNPYGSAAHASRGWDALTDLVNDVVHVLVTQPAPAGPHLVHAVQTSTRRNGRPSPGRRAAQDTQSSSGGPQHSGDSPSDYDDESHAEVWSLVRQAQQGDGDAFGELYDRYVDVVFRFIYFRVNDRALAEDFTSETFLRALRRIGSISYQGRDIGAWFVTIARNIIFDHMKSARHRLETTTADTIEGKEHEQSTEQAVLLNLQTERLMEAVNQLGDEQRECVTLRFIQGLSVSETAAAMGKNDGAIKALQHRAVRKLADLIGNELR